MKTKGFLLCLLFLMLGTTTVLADKYYMPSSYKGGSNPRYTSLAGMVGQRVMIYNAGLKDNIDYTGFLYVVGEGLAFDKCKERDLYVHNECYVYTVEGYDTDSDGNYDYYALKSLSTGTYVDFDGTLSADIVPLYISTYSECGAKFADKVEEYGYGTTLVDKITSGAAVFAVSNGSGEYWCGGESSFGTADSAAPFAFYRVNEVTSGDYLQDLHIYSRSDIFSAQKIYGLTMSGSSMSAYPAANASLENLVDGEYSTSVTTTGAASEQHYFQFNFSKTAENIYIYLRRNPNATDIPGEIQIYAKPEGGIFTPVQALTTGLDSNNDYYSGIIQLTGITNPVAIQIRNSDAGKPISFSEAYVLPVRDEVTDAFEYFKEPIPLRSSAAQYTDVVVKNNKENPDVKLLSGVPVAGNKYRIYADAYSSGAYVNRDIRTNGSNALVANESYLSATADNLDYFHWYCEQVPGGLAFKNVKTGKYLTLDGTQDNVYTWTINTVLTHRHGVPLKNGSGEYLTVHNDGTTFETGVTSVFDQTAVNTMVKGGNTADDAADDVTVAAGVCSDFVFLPVERTSGEKKVTFTANELVKRNSKFVWNEAEYTLPFSRIFADSDADPELTLNCPETHTFDGFYIDGVKSDAYTKNGDVYTFDIDNAGVADNSVVEIRYSFSTVEDFSTSGKFYYICNLQEQAAAQQARPQRTSINVGTGQTSQTATYSYYAAFDSKNTNMTLVGKSGLDAASLFYFTSVNRSENNDYDQVYIHNVLTTAMCKSAKEWTDGGALYYLQPNAVADGSDTHQGYSISRTKLTAINNPGDAWTASMGGDADVVTDGSAESASAAWAFVEVTEEDALKMINDYIVKFKAYSISIISNYSGELVNPDKVVAYKDAINAINSTSTATGDAMEQLRRLYSLSIKARYDILALPLVTTEDGTDKVSPKWYYIKNVKSENFYAKYAGINNYMSLTDGSADGSKKLSNLFYIANENGEAVNANNVNEYLKVHIHNFMTYNDSVMLGKNTNLASATDIVRTNEKEQAMTVLSNVGILPTDAWRIAFEVESDGTNLNGYGTCYLAATQSSNGALGDYFPEGFQIYFRADRTLAVRAGNSGDDRYKFNHLDGAFSHIKIVLTYGGGNLKIDVTNDAGVTQSVELACSFRNGITNLYAALPMTGVKISSITVDKVDAMKWTEHDNENRDWYILPSSNADYPGLAIVMDGNDDNNLGWTNYRSEDNTVFVDAGNADNSSWQFERVTDFDNHINELIELYGIKQCVIYNKEYVALYNLIMAKKARIEAEENGADEEADFNEVYDAILNYTGPMPEELRAPKPGKFYTIHPASDVEEVEMSVHVDKTAGEISTNEVNRTTKIVTYNGDDNVEHDEYNSRGVWFFEGTADGDGFLPLEGLKFRNLHTQTMLNALGADGALLTEEGALGVTLAKMGGAKVAIQAGGSNMARGDVASRSIINAATDRTFASDKLVVTSSWRETTAVVNSTIAQDLVGENVKLTVSGVDNVTAVLGSNYAVRTGEESNEHQLGDSIICPDVNANSADITNKPIELIYTLTGLADEFTFNHIALDIHAFNGARKYQKNNDNVDRQWNVKAQVGNGDGNFTDFFTLTDIDIAAGVGEDDNVHQKWGLAGNEFTTTTGTLILKLTITKGTNNGGCFFGLSEVALSNVADVWYIEEIAEPEYIYHKTFIEDGYSTLMLGFNSTIPSNVEAYTANSDDKFITGYRYLSMNQVEGTELPAMQPVVLRHSTEGADLTTKFYYNAGTKTMTDDGYMQGSLYFTVVPVPEGVNLYMLQQEKTGPKMYWIYEEYDGDGDLVDENGNKNPNGGSTDAGGHVLCKANRAYILIDNGEAQDQSVFMFSFKPGDTTGIFSIDDENYRKVTDAVVEGIYDIHGRKLSEITRPGIYIVNGKKIVVK